MSANVRKCPHLSTFAEFILSFQYFNQRHENDARAAAIHAAEDLSPVRANRQGTHKGSVPNPIHNVKERFSSNLSMRTKIEQT